MKKSNKVFSKSKALLPMAALSLLGLGDVNSNSDFNDLQVTRNLQKNQTSKIEIVFETLKSVYEGELIDLAVVMKKSNGIAQNSRSVCSKSKSKSKSRSFSKSTCSRSKSSSASLKQNLRQYIEERELNDLVENAQAQFTKELEIAKQFVEIEGKEIIG